MDSIVNDTLSGFFKSFKGLRQGDPLSPYLFVLAKEALSCLFRMARESGFFIGFKVNGRDDEGLEVTHLLFVDDTLVFCEAFHAQMTYLSWLLMWFEAILGLQINLTKSKLILVEKVKDLKELARVIGCKVVVLLTTYLGLLLGTPYNSVVAEDGVEERFSKILALWKRQYISKGGRLMFIRNKDENIAIYRRNIVYRKAWKNI